MKIKFLDDPDMLNYIEIPEKDWVTSKYIQTISQIARATLKKLPKGLKIDPSYRLGGLSFNSDGEFSIQIPETIRNATLTLRSSSYGPIILPKGLEYELIPNSQLFFTHNGTKYAFYFQRDSGGSSE